MRNVMSSAISAFFRSVAKRIRVSETENESDVRAGSSIDGSTSDQASTSTNVEVARNVIALTDQIIEKSGNNIPTLSTSFDINTLPNELPTREGRSLRREWFTDFAWLHCNDDGTCHCSSCFRVFLIQGNTKEFKTVNGLTLFSSTVGLLKPGPCENVCNYFIFVDKILEFLDFS